MKVKFTHPVLEYIYEDSRIEYDKANKQYYIILDGHKIVCPRCKGSGTHFRSDLDDSKLVDSLQEDGDYEGLDDYWSGAYDQRCTECRGQNVVNEVNWDLHPEIYQELKDWYECQRETAAIHAAERAFGA